MHPVLHFLEEIVVGAVGTVENSAQLFFAEFSTVCIAPPLPNPHLVKFADGNYYIGGFDADSRIPRRVRRPAFAYSVSLGRGNEGARTPQK